MSLLHWGNIKGFPTKKESLQFSNFVDFKKNYFNTNKPFIIFFGAFDLEPIREISHIPYTISFLNRTGLDIFLYEPLSLYIENKDFNFGFYSEFPYEINFDSIRAKEFDCIKDYILKNKLTNVTVHTCDYDVEKYLPYYKNYFNAICDDIFVKQIRSLPPYPEKNLKITKKFIVPNWRYSKHRHLITSYVSQFDANYSWYYKCTFEKLKENLWFDLEKWKDSDIYNSIKNGVEHLNSNAPVCLDILTNTATTINETSGCYWPEKTLSYNPALTNADNKSLSSFYDESFCVVVNETRFAQPTGNFSEKLLDAVKRKKPFILAAPPNTLEYFKSFGFKTFDSFWNEDYDSTVNHEQRLEKIFQLINNINSKSLEDLAQMYQKMEDIIEHNFQLLLKTHT